MADLGREAGGDPLDVDLRRAFAGLEDSRVRYVVLRGYSPLTELRETVDVDLFVAREDMATASVVLKGAGWVRRHRQVGRYPHVFFDSWSGGPGLVRSIDVVTELCYGDRLLTLDAGRGLLLRARLIDGVRIPDPVDALFTFALHLSLDKRRVTPASRARALALTAAYRSLPDGRSVLRERFGEQAAGFVDRFVASAAESVVGDIADLSRIAQRLNVLRARGLLPRLDRMRSRVSQFRRSVVRVAILGVDGSGKSTLIRRLVDAPSTLRVGSGYLGGNQFRTWPIRWLQARLEGHRRRRELSSVKFRVLENLHALWWPFELAARMAIAEHRSELVLYDRFPLGQDDVRPTTLWGTFMYRFASCARWLRPRADVVVLLDGDDRIIWERKREFPFEEHQRTQARYRSLVSALPGETAFVRTDRSPEESVEALKSALAASPVVRRKIYRD